MLTPVQSPPVQTSAASPTGVGRAVDAAGITRLHTDTRTLGPTIDANLGVSAFIPTPPGGGVRDRAAAAMTAGEKWAGEVSRLADFLDVNLGNSLNFAHADVRHLSHDISHQAPDARIARDTQQLLGDWGTKGRQAFDTIRHGLFRNAEQDIGQAAHALSRGGVTSPAIQSAMREVGDVLRLVDDFMSEPGMPPGPIGGPIGPGGPSRGPFDALLDHAMARLYQAMGDDVRAHPDHQQAIMAAAGSVGNALRNLQTGMTAVYVTQAGIQQDLTRLGWTPQPLPRPTPMPLPGPQPTTQPQPPASAPANGLAPTVPQAA